MRKSKLPILEHIAEIEKDWRARGHKIEEHKSDKDELLKALVFQDEFLPVYKKVIDRERCERHLKYCQLHQSAKGMEAAKFDDSKDGLHDAIMELPFNAVLLQNAAKYLHQINHAHLVRNAILYWFHYAHELRYPILCYEGGPGYYGAITSHGYWVDAASWILAVFNRLEPDFLEYRELTNALQVIKSNPADASALAIIKRETGKLENYLSKGRRIGRG